MVDRKKYGSSYIPDCPLCQGTNGGHYQTCPSYGGEKADERGSAEPFPYSKPLAELVPIGFASVVDLEAYAPMLQLGPHLPGVRDMAMFTKDQLKAACNAAHPDSAQARDAAQAVELTDEQVVAFAKEHQWKLSEHYGATVFQFRLSGLLPFARAIERAVLAKNGLGGKQ